MQNSRLENASWECVDNGSDSWHVESRCHSGCIYESEDLLRAALGDTAIALVIDAFISEAFWQVELTRQMACVVSYKTGC